MDKFVSNSSKESMFTVRIIIHVYIRAIKFYLVINFICFF